MKVHALSVSLLLLLFVTCTPTAEAARTSDAKCYPADDSENGINIPLICVTGVTTITAAGSDTPCYNAGDAKDPGETCKKFTYAGTAQVLLPIEVTLDGYGSHNEGLSCTQVTSCSDSIDAYYFADSSHCGHLVVEAISVVGRVRLEVDGC